jgi:hypothetical protein
MPSRRDYISPDYGMIILNIQKELNFNSLLRMSHPLEDKMVSSFSPSTPKIKKLFGNVISPNKIILRLINSMFTLN